MTIGAFILIDSVTTYLIIGLNHDKSLDANDFIILLHKQPIYTLFFGLKDCIFVLGKSYTTSSCRIPQGGNAARVYGCSGAM